MKLDRNKRPMRQYHLKYSNNPSLKDRLKCEFIFLSQPSPFPRQHSLLKADSHIACRAHAVPMPFPCHAVPLKVYNVSFSFDLHSAAVSDSHLPCHAHAMLWPCRSSQGHGTARPSRGGLWATYTRSASTGYHVEFHEGCYQKHTNPPHNDSYLRL